MSLNSEMKDHMDAVRKVTGVSEFLSLASSTDVLKQLSGIRVDLNTYYEGSLNDIEDNSILFVTGPSQDNGANKPVSIEDQKSPVDNAWLIILTLVTPFSGGRRWQIAIPDNDCKAFLRVDNSGNWTSWIKLGGGTVNALLKSLSDLMYYYLLPNRKEV